MTRYGSQCFGPRAPTTVQRGFAGIVAAIGFLAACDAAAQRPVTADPPPKPAERFFMDPPGMVVEDFVTGLEVVRELTFLPDGRLLITERAGRVRLVTPDGRLLAEPWAAPANVFHSGGGGVMDLALHPEYPREPWVYVMYTLETDAGPVNRVVRYRDAGERGTDMEVILDDLRGILRVTPAGGVPPDNPWPGSPVWAIGLRNVQGLAFHPRTRALFAADHGPTDRDQLHVVEGGRNYGWPRVLGAAGVAGYEDPLLEWIPAAPPGSLVFYDHGAVAELRGDLLVTTLRTEALIRLRFEDPAQPHRPTSIERWFVDEDLGASAFGEDQSAFGRLRALAVGPNGAIYVGTSNRDRGRGFIREGEDRVIRIAPARR